MAVWSETNVVEISQTKRMDSDFFHPHYITTENIVTKLEQKNQLGRLGQFIVGPFGSAFHVSNYDPNSKFRYIRGKDVKPFQLQNSDNMYMPEQDFRRLEKYSVCKEDLIISVVGTLGNVAIIPENEKAIFSCKSTLFRNSSIDAYYLLAYLNSKYGRTCLLRRQRGAVQTGLNKEDLKTVPVAIFSDQNHKYIGDLIRKALWLNYDAQSLYTQSEQLLEQELGIDKLEFEKPMGYETSFSEVMENNRADADYYQVKYLQIRNMIKKYHNGWKYLINIADSLTPNIDPHKNPNKKYHYIELSNIDSALGIIEDNKSVAGKNMPLRARRIVRTGDIIASSVVGSVDKAALIHEENNKRIASTGFFHFRPKKIQSEFLLILIRSKLVTEQLQQEATGGILSAVSDSRLQHIIVPDIDVALQNQIVKLVLKSHNAKREAEQLLEKAKARVEQLIEQAAEES